MNINTNINSRNGVGDMQYNIMKKAFGMVVVAAALFLASVMSACGEGEPTKNEIPQSQTVSSRLEAPDKETLKKELCGSWGRLGEVMHEFYSDDTCIVGGVFGDYEISAEGSLILTTVNGTATEYVWDDMTKQNYWSLVGDTLTVNGNQFTRIDAETVDNAE